ncbi:MAG: hypothetical protein HKN76_17875 [Saprospiraceae bacterium]|nr:hypothetical protein [Saprospiraceae bacterium]
MSNVYELQIVNMRFQHVGSREQLAQLVSLVDQTLEVKCLVKNLYSCHIF